MNKKLISVLVSGILVVSFLVFPGRGLAAMENPVSVQALQVQIQALLDQISQLQKQVDAIKAAGSGGSDSVPIVNLPETQLLENKPGVYLKESLGLLIGDRVQVREKLRVRVSPGSEIVATLLGGELGTVVEAPRRSGNYWWVNVRWDNGVVGWSAEDWINKVTQLNNKPPIINSLTGPSSLAVGQDGTWYMTATDPEGAKLRYDFYWDNSCTGSSCVNGYIGSGETIGATHAFFKSGSHTVLGQVSDGGVLATRLMTINVTDTTSTTFAQNLPPTNLSLSVAPSLTSPLHVDASVSAVDLGWPTLKYEINWGDGSPVVFNYAGSAYLWSRGHDYSNPGAYTVVFTATEQDGLSASMSKSVRVGSVATTFTCGDINADGVVSQSDVTTLTNHLFSGGTVPAGVKTDLDGNGAPNVFDQIALTEYLGAIGPYPTCGQPTVLAIACGDVNKDGKVDGLDSKYLQNYIYRGAKLPSGVSGDLNGDGLPNWADLDALNGYLGRTMPAPTCAAPQPPKINLPTEASVLDSIRLQLDSISSQIRSLLGR